MHVSRFPQLGGEVFFTERHLPIGAKPALRLFFPGLVKKVRYWLFYHFWIKI
jgi:hypothetical protein